MQIEWLLYPACFVLSWAAASLVAGYGAKIRLLDYPSKRSSHSHVTPRGGGIGITAVLVIASLLLNVRLNVWLPAVLISLISLLSDRFTISPKLRLLLQFLCSFAFLYGFLEGDAHLLDYIICIGLSIYICGTANMYNFMDGIDGIAGVMGVIGFGLLALFFYTRGIEPSLQKLSICISLACLGFLTLNLPKARVFMGDVGSILLGFVFVTMVISGSTQLSMGLGASAFLFVFYADELVTMSVRLKDGENLLTPHRRHLYQLLANEGGLPHWKIALGYGILQLVVGMAIIELEHWGMGAVLMFLSACTVLSVVIHQTIRHRLEIQA